MPQTNVGGVLLGDLILGSSLSGSSGGGGATPVIFANVKHTLNLTQSVRNTNTKVNSLFTPFQIITYTHVANKAVTSNLNLTQTIVAHKVLGVSQNLPLTQTIVAYASKGVKNQLVFNQTVTYNIARNLLVNQTLGFNQAATIVQAKRYTVHHGFGMNSIVGQQKVISRSVNQTINWTQEIRRQVFIRSVTSVYAPTQSVVRTPVYKNSASSQLVLNQSIGLNMTYHRSVNDLLVFYPTRSVYVGMGDVYYYIIDNIQYSHIPAYKVGKKTNPHCVLQVPNAAITLPSPDWGDTENYEGIFTIRRSMNGIPYTHVRQLSLRKLKLPWTLAKRKAWELREFLIQHNAELMTLTTWKGDKWFVNLLTNPFELTVRGRYEAENEKVSVDLEFEGLKVM